ncbi:hypothetical protein BDR26DRAFT_88423 [Obelidium mucronatum]|nr:hypothetical protein BDR26DRAFT_88423 [Obelidium mucronatum]
MCVNPDDAVTPIPGSPANIQLPNMDHIIKDSPKAVYQPTLLGAKLLGWDLAVDTPGVRGAVENFFRKKSEHPEAIRTSNTHHSGRASVTDAHAERKSNAGSMESEGGNKSKSASASKSLNYIATDGDDADLYGWESCHTNLISMDGNATRSKTTSLAPSSVSVSGGAQSNSQGPGNEGKGSIDTSSITKIISAARPKVHAIKKLAAANHKDAPEYLPMDPNLPRDPMVLQLKEKTHNLRLVMILENGALCDEFCKYNYFMYSQENFNFWRDADAFRRLYAPPGAVVIPGQTIRYNTETIFEEKTSQGGGGDEKKTSTTSKTSASSMTPPLWQIVAHAMAMYLKYIVDDGPYEINVGIIRKKNITATIATQDLMPFFELINPDSIIKEDMIEPKTVLLPGTENMLMSRLALLEKTTSLNIRADLFDVAENHIFQLMATDSVPKFLKTTAYHNTMSALIKAGTLKTFGDEENGDKRESLGRKPSNAGVTAGRLSAAKGRTTQTSVDGPRPESPDGEPDQESSQYEGPRQDLAKFAAEKKNSIVSTDKAVVGGASKAEEAAV